MPRFVATFRWTMTKSVYFDAANQSEAEGKAEEIGHDLDPDEEGSYMPDSFECAGVSEAKVYPPK